MRLLWSPVTGRQPVARMPTFRCGTCIHTWVDGQLLNPSRLPPHQAVVLHTLPADLQPVGRGKVDRLGQVKAMVKAGMIGPGEGDDELAGVLVHPDDNNGNDGFSLLVFIVSVMGEMIKRGGKRERERKIDRDRERERRKKNSKAERTILNIIY